jgi:hypothetical protein
MIANCNGTFTAQVRNAVKRSMGKPKGKTKFRRTGRK